ncbi:hypothetical protein DUI70_4254 [Streptomyces albus]|nr:hypothetical protein DUI70_4254 [Streptomyces albus]
MAPALALDVVLAHADSPGEAGWLRIGAAGPWSRCRTTPWYRAMNSPGREGNRQLSAGRLSRRRSAAGSGPGSRHIPLVCSGT